MPGGLSLGPPPFHRASHYGSVPHRPGFGEPIKRPARPTMENGHDSLHINGGGSNTAALFRRPEREWLHATACPVLCLNRTHAGFLHRRAHRGMREGAEWNLPFLRCTLAPKFSLMTSLERPDVFIYVSSLPILWMWCLPFCIYVGLSLRRGGLLSIILVMIVSSITLYIPLASFVCSRFRQCTNGYW